MADKHIDWAARQNVPDYVIDALIEWLDIRQHDKTYKTSGMYEKVRHWVHGDEVVDSKEIMTTPESYIFTFGYDHTDKDGNSLRNCYVELPGTYEGARDLMISLFGRDWSMQYDSVARATGNGKYKLTNKSADLVPWEVWT